MEYPVYNGLNVEPAPCMEEGDAPVMKNEAVTFHEAMRAP